MATLCWRFLLACIVLEVMHGQIPEDDECSEQDAWNTDETLVAAGELSDAAWNAIKSDLNPQVNRRLIPVTPESIMPVYANLDIPVVFHILYDSDTNPDGIAPDEDQQWYSQYVQILQNLHLDFNAANPDLTPFPQWQGRIGDMNLTFFINRIIYKSVGSNSPYPPKSSSSNSPPYTLLQVEATGSAPVDAEHHLDLWFAYGQRSYSAYAYRPPFQALGRHGATFNMEYLTGVRQRPTVYTHEVGHWVGLKHIWGNSDRQGQASCALDDDIDDTPNMGDKWSLPQSGSCPTDLSGNTCDAGLPGDEPDMFDNFMSYALPCRNFYTHQQVQRARVAEDENGTPIGIRRSFYEYQDPSIEAETEFVSFFYFVDKLDECMTGDHKREFCLRNNGKFRVCCEWALCVSFSRNPFVDVYDDLEMILGDHASCSPGFQRIDTVVMPDKAGEPDSLYVCYKKVPQTDPMSSSTIIDLNLEHLGDRMRLVWIDKAGNMHSQTENIPKADIDVTPQPSFPTTAAPTGTGWSKPTASPTRPSGWWTVSPTVSTTAAPTTATEPPTNSPTKPSLAPSRSPTHWTASPTHTWTTRSPSKWGHSWSSSKSSSSEADIQIKLSLHVGGNWQKNGEAVSHSVVHDVQADEDGSVVLKKSIKYN